MKGVTKGSGNVFADLGFEDAEEMQLRAHLTQQIYSIIKQRELTQGKAAEILGPEYDLEIVEMHHRLKRDAPSGSAKTLSEILSNVRKQQLDKVPAN